MKIKESSADNQSGFTLIEVMIASAVLLIGLLTIGAAFSQGMLVMARAPLQLIAKEKMAEALDNTTANLENGSIAPIDTTATTELLTGVVTLNKDNSNNDRTIDLRALDFRRRVRVTPVSNVWEVQIDVSYNTGGQTKTHTQTVQVRRN